MPFRVDIVVPVFHEPENFLTMYQALRERVRSDWRTLLIYDMPEDTTLEAARPVAERDSRVRLVRNQSRGVLEAVKTGFREAEADAVLVMMVDDPPEVIGKVDEMVTVFYEQGATIVAASRYMRGGVSKSDHFLKRALSLLAGLSLHRFIGLPVHDATYATRLYRKAFLDRTTVESRQGFEFTLELTLKAYLAGGKLIEIPVLWRDRTVGVSRFKLIRWIPGYLRWYVYGIVRYWLPRSSVMAD